MADPTHAHRRAFLDRYVTPETVALEIGAADLPTYRRDELAIEFLDVQSADDLAAQYGGLEHRDATRVERVDHVVPGGRPSRAPSIAGTR